MTVHVIFNVKLDAGSTRKARLVSYGHNLDTPTSMTYDTVVYRDIVIIYLYLLLSMALMYNVPMGIMPTSTPIPRSPYTSMLERNLVNIRAIYSFWLECCMG